MIDTFRTLLAAGDKGLWVFIGILAVAFICLVAFTLISFCMVKPPELELEDDERRSTETPLQVGHMDDERPQLKLVDTTGDERLRRWMRQQLIERANRHFRI